MLWSPTNKYHHELKEEPTCIPTERILRNNLFQQEVAEVQKFEVHVYQVTLSAGLVPVYSRKLDTIIIVKVRRSKRTISSPLIGYISTNSLSYKTVSSKNQTGLFDQLFSLWPIIDLGSVPSVRRTARVYTVIM